MTLRILDMYSLPTILFNIRKYSFETHDFTHLSACDHSGYTQN